MFGPRMSAARRKSAKTEHGDLLILHPMDPPPQHSPVPPRGPSGARLQFISRWRGCAGFSLLGLAVTLFVLAVIAAVGTPFLRQRAIERKTNAIVADLRAFAAAYQAFAHERGDWPPQVAPGVVPAGMETRLAQTSWKEPTPIGGRFHWARRTLQQGMRYEAALVISDSREHQVSRDKNQLEHIDRQIDDGDLTTGKFRLGYRNQPVFVVEN